MLASAGDYVNGLQDSQVKICPKHFGLESSCDDVTCDVQCDINITPLRADSSYCWEAKHTVKLVPCFLSILNGTFSRGVFH